MSEATLPALDPRVAATMNRARQGKSRFATPEDAFKWLRSPGFESRDWKAERELERAMECRRPLVNRCQCGRVISGRPDGQGQKWMACKACVDAELKATAGLIATQEAFEAFLGDFDPSEREGVCKALAPYMNIEVAA